MGASASKPVRTAPVRYVAKELPRGNVDVKAMEERFRKAQFSMQGINRRQDPVHLEPTMYVETARDADATQVMDHTAPRWNLNAWMELMDNSRETYTILSGNLPMSWERDKYEPYALVRGRIDDEDLSWVLREEQRKMPIAQLSEHTKLDAQTLQDILDTVELPRTQYRNFQGKLHKAVDDMNESLRVRQEQRKARREDETLDRIGYTPEEIADDRQYRTERSRGVKTLDELGVSIREHKKLSRATANRDMEDLLEQRRQQQIERGQYVPTEEEVALPEGTPKNVLQGMRTMRTQVMKNVHRLDANKDPEALSKIEWWINRSRLIRRHRDVIHGVPTYHDGAKSTEEGLRKQMREAIGSRVSGDDKLAGDELGDMRQMIDNLRERKEAGIDDTHVETYEDESCQHPIYRFPKKPLE